jgi:hypothetical protein
MGPLIGLAVIGGKGLISAVTQKESAYGNSDFFAKFADSVKNQTVDKDGDGKVSFTNVIEGGLTVASGMGFIPGGAIPCLDIAGSGGGSLFSGGGVEQNILSSLLK